MKKKIQISIGSLARARDRFENGWLERKQAAREPHRYD